MRRRRRRERGDSRPHHPSTKSTIVPTKSLMSSTHHFYILTLSKILETLAEKSKQTRRGKFEKGMKKGTDAAITHTYVVVLYVLHEKDSMGHLSINARMERIFQISSCKLIHFASTSEKE